MVDNCDKNAECMEEAVGGRFFGGDNQQGKQYLQDNQMTLLARLDWVSEI
jgi:hypothetical protein